MSSRISRLTFYLKFRFVSDLGPRDLVQLPPCLAWGGSRGRQAWGLAARLPVLPLAGAQSDSGQSPTVASQVASGTQKDLSSQRRKTSVSSDPQHAGSRSVRGGSCFTVGFLRCPPAPSSRPCCMFAHPVGKQAVPPAPARMPVHGLAIKQACHGSCLRSFREGGRSPAQCPLLHHPRVGIPVSLRSESFDFSGVCSSFDHLCSVICL